MKQAQALKSMVDNAHDKAVEMLAEFFDWLDECEAQPTTAIVHLFPAYLPKCRRCHHPVTDHRHYHSIWEDKVHTQTVVDEMARSKFEVALNDRLGYQADFSKTEKPSARSMLKL